jgi:hypothetical protein
MTHTHSLMVYHGRAGVWHGRRAAILRDIEDNGPATPRQIRDRLGFQDMNAVQPRITELIAAGEIVEMDGAVSPETGARMRVVGFPRTRFNYGPRSMCPEPEPADGQLVLPL